MRLTVSVVWVPLTAMSRTAETIEPLSRDHLKRAVPSAPPCEFRCGRAGSRGRDSRKPAAGCRDRRVPAARSRGWSAGRPTAGRRPACRRPHLSTGVDANLPDRLPPRRRIGAAERIVEQVRILDISDFAIPDIEIDDGIARRRFSQPLVCMR